MRQCLLSFAPSKSTPATVNRDPLFSGPSPLVKASKWRPDVKDANLPTVNSTHTVLKTAQPSTTNGTRRKQQRLHPVCRSTNPAARFFQPADNRTNGQCLHRILPPPLHRAASSGKIWLDYNTCWRVRPNLFFPQSLPCLAMSLPL